MLLEALFILYWSEYLPVMLAVEDKCSFYTMGSRPNFLFPTLPNHQIQKDLGSEWKHEELFIFLFEAVPFC